MPDFSQVYSFLGSVFDPNATGHIQRLKQMDPINFETVCIQVFSNSFITFLDSTIVFVEASF